MYEVIDKCGILRRKFSLFWYNWFERVKIKSNFKFFEMLEDSP